MAGKRQHYIPRFLQRGFLDVSDSKADRTWLYRRGEKPRLVGIRDVGVGEYFYSKLSSDGIKTLDDLITEFEGELDGYLTFIRSIPVGEEVDAKAAASLVAHLAIRTNHVRAVFTQGFEKITDEMAGLLSDSTKMRELMGVDTPHLSVNSETPISKAFDAVSLEKYSFPPALSKRLLSFFTREFFDYFYKEVQPGLSQKIVEVVNRISSLTRDAHNNALLRADHSSWENKLSTLTWKIYSFPGAILPDCVVLVRESNEAFVPFLLSSPDKLETVILPITNNKILIGSSSAGIDLNVELINMASMECSESFFISHQGNDDVSLSHLIGTRCFNSINSIVSEAISELSLSSSATSEIQQPMIKKNFLQPVSFSLTCVGFADSDTSKSLGNIVRIIIWELSRRMPLSSIDGFTFAVDYASALINLDRGDPNLAHGITQQRNYGKAIAKCVKVKRGDESKNHIVMDAAIANGLLADDESERVSSIHTIVNMLSHISHEALYEVQLKNDKTAPDDFSRLFHHAVSAAPGSYYAARESAFCNLSAGLRYADLLCDSITSAQNVIRNAKLIYRDNGDLDTFLKISVSQVSFIISHAAQWLGHRDGETESDELTKTSLLENLKVFGLNCWMELLGRDLSRLYEIKGQFTGVNLYALDRHVERLLWVFHIYPWPLDDGGVYVSVPIIAEENLLNNQLENV